MPGTVELRKANFTKRLKEIMDSNYDFEKEITITAGATASSLYCLFFNSKYR
ncbi:MAG: hypothetical protein MZV64_47545 [Ignavibacteriales bacterium]|nr:hypothetical protein [Ignavibacteriales bacterium]